MEDSLIIQYPSLFHISFFFSSVKIIMVKNPMSLCLPQHKGSHLVCKSHQSPIQYPADGHRHQIKGEIITHRIRMVSRNNSLSCSNYESYLTGGAGGTANMTRDWTGNRDTLFAISTAPTIQQKHWRHHNTYSLYSGVFSVAFHAPWRPICLLKYKMFLCILLKLYPTKSTHLLWRVELPVAY